MPLSRRFTFPHLRKSADLIYKGRPLLSHYVSEGGEHYLFYWLDGDLLRNQWLVCRVRLDQLLKYTDRKLTLHALLLTPPDGFLYAVDTDNGSQLQFQRISIVFPADIPSRQLPPKDSFYKGSPHTQPLDLLDLSHKYDSGLLQIHFGQSPRIGYGTIDLALLAPALHHLHEMADALGHSYTRRQADTRHLKGRFSKDDHKKTLGSAAQYELIHTLPGSFNLVLRPKNQQMALPGQEGEADKFGRYWQDFIADSFDFERLKAAAAHVDGRVMASYQNLLKLVKATRLHLQLRWANHRTGLEWQQAVGPQEADHLLENLTRLEYRTDRLLRLTGRFLALDTRTHYYTFQSEGDKQVSKGYMATALHPNVPLVVFSRRYEVVVQRTETKQAGKPRPLTKDMLTAFAELQISRQPLSLFSERLESTPDSL